MAEIELNGMEMMMVQLTVRMKLRIKASTELGLGAFETRNAASTTCSPASARDIVFKGDVSAVALRQHVAWQQTPHVADTILSIVLSAR